MTVSEQRDIVITFELHNSRNLITRDDLLQAIKTAVDWGKLIPLENKAVRTGEGEKRAHPVAEDIDTWFKNNYWIKDNARLDDFHLMWARERSGSLLRTTIKEEWDTREMVMDAIMMGVNAGINGSQNSIVEFAVVLLGKSIIMPTRTVHVDKLDEVLEVFLRIAPPVIEVLQPYYAALTNRRQLELYGKDVMVGKLKYIYWCNYFGPIYLEKYGTKFLKNAPGFKIQPIGDGIWYQVTEKLDEFRDENLRKQVAEYFADIDGLRLA